MKNNAIAQRAGDLINDANRKAEQLAEDARKKAERLREEAEAKAKRMKEEAKATAERMLARTKEKAGQAREELSRSAHSMTEKVFSLGVGSLAAVFVIKILLNEYSTWTHNQDVNTAFDNAIQKQESEGNTPSFSDAEYIQFANMIEQATNGVGTDKQIIYGVFEKMKNTADVLKLMQTYGKRMNDLFFVPMGRFSLSEILISELSTSERATLNAKLSKKGITISF
jgi:cell division protein FtsL